ncbi:MAG TPA: SIR2 family protein [Polyangia bacterium]
MSTTRHVLLTGAGFTHNFGAPLADGVWNLLLAHPAVEKTPRVRALLLQNQNFEDAYHLIENGAEFSPSERTAIEAAVRDAYDHIDAILREWRLSGSSPYPVNVYGLQNFIARFSGTVAEPGLFFTLNQDLFVERHYYNGSRPSLPGIQHHPEWFSANWCHAEQTAGHRRIVPASAVPSDLIAGKGFLYVKLHGSQNWYSSSGRQRMVIGRYKTEQIANEPLLAAYWQIYKEAMCRPGVKLFTVGYGFADEHVNSVISDAVTTHGLRVYVLSPGSASTLRAQIEKAPHGPSIWNGLGAHYSATLAEVFPGNQATTALWNKIESSFFREGAG